MNTRPPTMPPPTQPTLPPIHPMMPLPQTMTPSLQKIRHLLENYSMVRNILSLNVILLRRDLIHKYAVEWCAAYLHGLSHLSGYPRYTSDRIISWTCSQLLPIYSNSMLGSLQLMVDLRGMHFNTNKALYINFHKHA